MIKIAIAAASAKFEIMADGTVARILAVAASMIGLFVAYRLLA
jgi:hypothetical protein